MSHRNMDGAHTGPFPAEAGPTGEMRRLLERVFLVGPALAGKLFKRHIAIWMVPRPASSRLKPVPQEKCVVCWNAFFW